MRVIQLKFTNTNPYFFSKGGGGGAPSAPVLDPPLMTINKYDICKNKHHDGVNRRFSYNITGKFYRSDANLKKGSYAY